MNVLVTDGNSRVALAVVRALGRAGAHVRVVEQERFARRTPAAFRSRFARERRVLPSLGPDGAFLRALAEAARGADVILPVSTHMVLALAEARAALPAPVPVAAPETLRRANDKAALLDVARRAGVPVPESHLPRSEGELDEVAGRIRWPAVVKLRDDEGTFLSPGERYRIVRTPSELRDAYRALHRLRPFPIVQERVAGEGYGVGALARDGELLAAVVHRRVREYPIEGGPSAFCESVRNVRLVEAARRILRELGWTGVAMVEFRGGPDDFRLLEVNPRFWGALPLATAAGVNFPWLLCRMALGRELGPAPIYAEGVRLRFLPMDLAAAWSAFRAGNGRRRYVWGFLRDLLDPRVRDGIFEAGDWSASMAWWLSRRP
ncbi:MAG TPA: ATP-grasp domain-containing protein [Planctomycetota bacterium]|nr:ATP-grasp domain-containing protein [Planctomycetota bacterium]